MKKRYFAPETEIVAACPGSLLYQTSVEYGGDGDDLPDEANTGLFDEVEAPASSDNGKLVDKLDHRWN